MTDWNKGLEKKILLRSKFTLTMRILRVILIVFFVYYIYMLGITLIADKLHVGNENKYFSSLALEWTVPNVRGDFDMKEEDMTIFGTKNVTYNLTKTIGQERFVIGEAQISKRLLNSFSTIYYSHPGQTQLNEITFSLPEDPRTGNKLKGNASPNVWETLDMLHEGTVAELAFSTSEFMESAQLLEALERYDLHVLWMPLYTGEFTHYEPSNYGSGTDTLWVPGLGLTGGKDHDENYYETFRMSGLGVDNVAESEQLMLKNMEKLLQKSESYYERFLGLRHLEDQYDYLTEEGFIVYGAVVTGPVKELLKLQDLAFIQGEQLGEVQLWNWQRDR